MKTTLLITAGILVLVLVGWLALHNQSELTDELPPRIECATLEQAHLEAASYAMAHGGLVSPVLGTGSMAPYIPAAPNRAPIVVAYVVTDPAATYDTLRKGQLVIYRPQFNPGFYCHIAAEKTSSGWIMSGLANAHSEADWRVTSSNYAYTVAAVFTVKP